MRISTDTEKAGKPEGYPAIATTLRRGLVKTECLYVKRPCPSVHTSYSQGTVPTLFCFPNIPGLKLNALPLHVGLPTVLVRVRNGPSPQFSWIRFHLAAKGFPRRPPLGSAVNRGNGSLWAAPAHALTERRIQQTARPVGCRCARRRSLIGTRAPQSRPTR